MRTLLFLLICLSSYSQSILDDIRWRGKNTIGLNFIGEGSIISINYSRDFFFKNHNMIDVNFGLGYSQPIRLGLFANFGVTEPDPIYLTFPHHVSYNFNIGRRKHYIELGAGGAFAYADNVKIKGYVFYPIVGYRLHPFKPGKWFLRVYASPLITNLRYPDGHGGLMTGVSF